MKQHLPSLKKEQASHSADSQQKSTHAYAQQKDDPTSISYSSAKAQANKPDCSAVTKKFGNSGMCGP